MAYPRAFTSTAFIFAVFTLLTLSKSEPADSRMDSILSKSIANFMRIKSELQNPQRRNSSIGEHETEGLQKRGDVSNPSHEGWNGLWSKIHLKTQDVPDFGHHEIHSMDEQGERFHLDSTPRHHVHHGSHHEPHFHHEVHEYHHSEHPHVHHEHYVTHEPIHNHIPVMHHANHHVDHHDEEDEESGDHEEHHTDATMHGDNDDWDVGGGYFQLEEHGSDVNVVALKKHGTKVHMSGGDFNVIRDPWRHHSLFAGLFHPHEMPGHGHIPMEQFHQHFTYIANDRAINHHIYEHHTHNEDHHVHEHDPGHEHDYFYHHPPEPNNHGDKGDKRGFDGDTPRNDTVTGQAKQQITGVPGGEVEEIITIPLSFSEDHGKHAATRTTLPLVNPDQERTSHSQNDNLAGGQGILAQQDATFTQQNHFSPMQHAGPPLDEMAEIRGKDDKPIDKEHKKELPKGKSPRLSPFNGNRNRPKFLGNVMEIPLGPLAPIVKRSLKVKRSVVHDLLKVRAQNWKPRLRRKRDMDRGKRLKKAFLAKLLMSKNR